MKAFVSLRWAIKQPSNTQVLNKTETAEKIIRQNKKDLKKPKTKQKTRFHSNMVHNGSQLAETDFKTINSSKDRIVNSIDYKVHLSAFASFQYLQTNHLNVPKPGVKFWVFAAAENFSDCGGRWWEQLLALLSISDWGATIISFHTMQWTVVPAMCESSL